MVMLTLKEAADLAGTTPAYLRVLIRRGKLAAEKRIERGQVVNYVTRAEIERYAGRTASQVSGDS